MSRVTYGAPGILGKHPSRDDFIALGNRGHEFVSFDAFLTRNVEWAEAKAGSGWPNAYNGAAVQAFVYRPTAGGRATALVGAFGPSRDRAGRRFPLTVAVPLFASNDLVAAPEILPLVLEACWLSSSQWVLSLDAAPDASIRLPADSFPAPEVDLDDALSSYAAWTRGLRTSELWPSLFQGEQQVDPTQILAVVSQTVASCRGIEQPSSPLALRLPLGAAGGAAVCFWLDWVCRIAHWKATVPSFFWSHDGERGSMLLALGNAPPCTLAELWLATGNREQICDVAHAPWTIRVTDGHPTEWLRAANDGSCTVAELLHAAHTVEF